MTADSNSPLLVRWLVALNQKPGACWCALLYLALPFVILLWLYYGARILLITLALWRRQSRLRASWNANRVDRLRHPDKYRGRD